MENNMQDCVFMEKLLIWLKKNFYKYKYPFVSSMVFGLLTYVFAFTNKLINHDEVISMFAKGTGLTSGRWALDFMHYIFPDFSMPWIYGVISILLVSVAACIVVEIFGIENKLIQMVLSGLIVSFPSLIGTFSYMFTASSYMLAFLLSILAVKFLIKESWKYRIFAIVCLTISIGIYQSYIAVAASLLVLYLLQRTLYTDEKVGTLIKNGIIYLLGLIVSLGLYYLVLQILLRVNSVELNTYASASFSDETSILDKLLDAYSAFAAEIVVRKYGLITTRASRVVHVIVFVFAAVVAFLTWLKTKLDKKILSLGLLLTYPLSINCMLLISGPESVHTLVLYSFVSVYVLLAFVFEQIGRVKQDASKMKTVCLRLAKEVIILGLAFVVISNVYAGNIAYLRMYLCYENMYGFYSSVMTMVKSTPGFDENSKVALVGDAGNSLHFHTDFLGVTGEIAGAYGINVNAYTRKEFIVNFIGTELPFASEEEVEKVEKTDEFSEMPIYPYYGSIKKIDDLIVVKFQE